MDKTLQTAEDERAAFEAWWNGDVTSERTKLTAWAAWQARAALASKPVQGGERLEKAAQAVLDRWNSPKWEWHKQGPTADLMAELNAALSSAPAQPEIGPDSENYAGDEAPLPADVPYPPSLDNVTIYNPYGPMSMDPTDGQPVRAYWDREGLRDYGARCIAWAETQASAPAQPVREPIPFVSDQVTAKEAGIRYSNADMAAAFIAGGRYMRQQVTNRHHGITKE